MTIDRRAFVAGTALVAVGPAIGACHPGLSRPADLSRLVLVIEGWAVPEGVSADQVWLRVGHGWRTVWR